MIRSRRLPGASIDPACPLDWSHPLNVGLVSDWTIVPNSGWRGGVTLRDLARGGRKPNDGTLTNSPGWQLGALSFPSTAYVLIPDNNALDLASTFAVAFYADLTVANGTIVSKGFDFGIRVESAATSLYVTSGGANRITVSTSLVSGRHWHCLTSDAGGSTYYVDGKSAGTGIQLSTWWSNANDLRIGAPGFSFYGSGTASAAMSFGNFGLWSRGLSPAKVAALYAESRRGNPERFRWIGTRAWSIPAAATVANNQGIAGSVGRILSC